MTAAMERATTSVVALEFFEFELAGCFALDNVAVAVTAFTEGSAAGTLAGCGTSTCDSGAVAVTFSGVAMTVRTLTGGTVGGGTLLGGTLAAGMCFAGIVVGEG